MAAPECAVSQASPGSLLFNTTANRVNALQGSVVVAALRPPPPPAKRRAAEPALNPLSFNFGKNNIRYALGTSWAGSSRSDGLKVVVRLQSTENDSKWFGVA